MTEYTILLFRSGRVWVTEPGEDAPTNSLTGDQPILTAQVVANSQISALGKLLLEYVDAARQPYQHIPICIEPCCEGKQ